MAPPYLLACRYWNHVQNTDPKIGFSQQKITLPPSSSNTAQNVLIYIARHHEIGASIGPKFNHIDAGRCASSETVASRRLSYQDIHNLTMSWRAALADLVP